MHLVLTDRLTCTRCGPQFGLILLAEQLENRRVLEGALGCPNCRDRYPIQQGFGDLRPAPRAAWLEPAQGSGDAGAAESPGQPSAGDAGAPDSEPGSSGGGSQAVDPGLLLELLGAAQGAGQTVVVGAAVDQLPGLRLRAGDELEFVAVGADLRLRPEEEGVSRLAAGGQLPFFDRSMRGVLLDGSGLSVDLVHEAARVLAPRHRVVVLDPGADGEAWLREAGLPEVHATGRLAAGAR